MSPFVFLVLVLYPHLSITSWFPEGVVQYTSTYESWIYE